MHDSRNVDAYINALPEWQQVICARARRLIHKADSRIEEQIKFGNRPYFVYLGNVCALLAAKDHVNVFLYDPNLNDSHNIINQGHENKTACSIQIRKDTFPDEEAFTDLIKQIVTHNDQGGWRSIA